MIVEIRLFHVPTFSQGFSKPPGSSDPGDRLDYWNSVAETDNGKSDSKENVPFRAFPFTVSHRGACL
jgi:hypothetical protein